MDTHWFSCTTLAIHGNSDLAQLYKKGHMGPLLIVRLHCLVPHISHLVSLLFVPLHAFKDLQFFLCFST